MREKIETEGDFEVSVINSSENNVKATYKDILQLPNNCDSGEKEQKIENLIKLSLNQNCTVVLKGPSISREINLEGNEVSLEKEAKNEFYQEFNQEESQLQMSKSLINKQDLKNIEDFDMYESLIQGQTMYQPPFLINPSREKTQSEYVFDIDFEKPLSLF